VVESVADPIPGGLNPQGAALRACQTSLAKTPGVSFN